MHESMTDLRNLVAETQLQRPKTDIGGIVDGFDPQIDGREEQGSMSKVLVMFSVLMNWCKSENVHVYTCWKKSLLVSINPEKNYRYIQYSYICWRCGGWEAH